MTSRPLAASRRNPLAVIDPSGYSSAAATSNRSGASSAIWSRGGNVGVRAMGVRNGCYRRSSPALRLAAAVPPRRLTVGM
jgi:hypothetical protein